MKIKTSDFLQILQALKPGIDEKERLEQSDSYIFKNGTVYTFNDEVAVMKTTDLDIVGAVPAKEFYTFISRVKDNQIDISNEDNKIRVKGRRFKADFNVEDPRLDLGTIPKPEKWFDLPENITEVIKLVSLSVSKNLATPILTCIHWEDDFLESCDNFRLTRYKLGKTFKGFDFPVFGDTLVKVANYKLKKVALTEGWLHFKDDSDCQLSIRINEGTYPDLSSLINRFKAGVEIEFPDTTISAVERAEAVTTPDEMGNKILMVEIKNGKINLKTEGALGRFSESLKCNCKEEFQFTIKSELLKGILSITNKATMSEDMSMLLFKEKDLLHLISL